MATDPNGRQDWAARGVLLLAVLSLFWPALLHPNTLLYPSFSPYSDLTVIHWPKAHLMAATWQATGSLPWWMPANLSGMPLAANPLAMLFYPPAWLFLWLPLNPAFNLLFILHLWWAGLGTYWLLRRGFQIEPLPALVGGLTFAMGGKLLAHAAAGHVSMGAALAWLPWAVGGTLLWVQRRRLRWLALAAVALAMELSTHSLIALYTGYWLAGYGLWQIVTSLTPRPPLPGGEGGRGDEGRVRERLLASSSLLAIPVLAGLLAAVQLLPLAELAGYSNRALSLAEAGEAALTPLTLGTGLFLPSTQGGHEMVTYLGLVPCLLAGWGLSRTDRRTWFWGAAVLAAALLALGPATPVFQWVYTWLPGLSWVRTPARAFFIAALAVSILAGLGAQRLARQSIRWSTPLAVIGGAFSLALGLGLWLGFGQLNRAALGLALLPALTLLPVGLVARRSLPGRWAVLALAGLLWVDLGSFDLTLMRFIPADAPFDEGKSPAAYLAGQPGLFRTYSPSYSLPAPTAAWSGIQTADGVEPVHLAAYDRFMALAGGYGGQFEGQPVPFSVAIPPFPPGSPVSEAFRDVQPDVRLLGLLNVEYLVSAFPIQDAGLSLVSGGPGGIVYRSSRALPRAWVIPASAAGAFLEPADGAAWPAQLSNLAETAARQLAAGGSEVTITDYQPNRIRADVRLEQSGLLVFSELWYPGWQADVDGKPRPVQPVAGLLRGVALEAGAHRVDIEYAPASLAWGTRISLAAWGGLVLGGAILWLTKAGSGIL